jgi:hypothetical protein
MTKKKQVTNEDLLKEIQELKKQLSEKTIKEFVPYPYPYYPLPWYPNYPWASPPSVWKPYCTTSTTIDTGNQYTLTS